MCVCVSDSGEIEKQLEDVSLARRDLEDSSRHIKTLEKQMKSITQERDELHRVQSVLLLCVFVRSVLISAKVRVVETQKDTPCNKT